MRLSVGCTTNTSESEFSVHTAVSPPVHPVFSIRRDVRKVLLVHSRCALVGLAPIVGVLQPVLAIQLVVQKVEPMARRTLRFRL